MDLLRIFYLTSVLLVLTQSVQVRAAVSRLAVDLQFLQRAVLQRDVAGLQKFLNKFGNIDKADADGMTLAHYAALQGLFSTVELLQHLGANVDIADQRALLPADYAEFGGHLETQQLLSGVAPATVDLFTAAAMNAQQALERLLADPNIDINARTADGKTALHLSAERGNFYATQRLLAAGADILAKDKDGKLPLEAAIDAEHALVVSVLLEAVDLNTKEHKGWTPLNWAVFSGNQAWTRALLERGAKVGEGCQNAIEVCLLLNDMEMFEIVRAVGGVDAASSRGDTSLMGVSRRGDERVVDALLAHGANTNVADMRRGYTPLRLAAENNHLSIVKKLIAHRAELNTVDSLDDTALIRAALRGNVEVVQVLIDAGADLNHVGAGGMTALMWAVYWNEKKTAQALIEGGAAINMVNVAGTSAVEWAARRSDAEMMRMVLKYFVGRSYEKTLELRAAMPAAMPEAGKRQLYNLAKGELIAAQDGVDYGTRMGVAQKHADFPLQWLIANGKLEVLGKMLEQPFDLDKPDAQGVTPVMQAVLSASPALETLLSHGADPNSTGSDDFPPLVRAAVLGNKDAAKALLEWRANPDARDAQGLTALMRAAEGGYFEFTELLLLEGADPNLVNENGDDALALAERGEHQEIANLLREAKGEEQ